MAADVRRSPRQFHICFRGRPRTSKSSKIHGNPRPPAAIATANVQGATNTTNVRGSPRRLPPAVFADFHGRPKRNNFHGHPRPSPGKYPTCDKYHGLPRKSAAIATAVSVHFVCFRGSFRRLVRGSPWVSVGMSTCVSRERVRGCPWMFTWVCRRVSAGVFAAVRWRLRLAVGAAVEVAVDIAVDIAMEINVPCGMASAMGLHGIPLLNAAFRGSPWEVRGSLWNIHGFPRKAVDMFVECREGRWTPPRSSAKHTNTVHPSQQVINHMHACGHPPTPTPIYGRVVRKQPSCCPRLSLDVTSSSLLLLLSGCCAVVLRMVFSCLCRPVSLCISN